MLFGNRSTEVVICEDESKTQVFEDMRRFLELAFAAKFLGSTTELAGSQEIVTDSYQIGWRRVAVVGETYRGVRLVGCKRLVRQITERSLNKWT